MKPKYLIAYAMIPLIVLLYTINVILICIMMPLNWVSDIVQDEIYRLISYGKKITEN